MTTKPHLSASHLGLACRCPEACRRRYIEGEIVPPGIAAAKGTSLHHGASANFQQKISTYVDLPEENLVESCVEQFKLQAKHGEYQLTPEETARGKRVVVAEATDDVARLARVHSQQQAPCYQPMATELSIRKSLPNCSHDLLGIVDLIDNTDAIVDLKTTARKKQQHEADVSVQLSVYYVLFRSQYGRAPRTLRLDTLVQTKTKTERQVLETQRTEADIDVLAHRMNAVLEMHRAGVYVPANPDDWFCNAKWCGYWSTCKYVHR